MRYIKSFANDAAIQASLDNKTLGKPYVALDDQLHRIDWNGKDSDYSKMYLTIEALESGTFYVKAANIGYSVNGGSWETTTGETALSLNQGDKVRFKGTAGGGRGLFAANTMAFNACGNIESLAYGDDFIGKESGISCYNMFISCSGLTSAENLILPATTLVDSCYFYMFYGCTSLTTAPALPATTLAKKCYQGMFFDCTSLTTAPALPATELITDCYRQMFNNCTSLTTAPVLPAGRLVDDCYSYMFQNCSSLNYVKCLATNPAMSMAGPLMLWLSGVSPTGTFVKKAGVNWRQQAIPSGWTVVEE